MINNLKVSICVPVYGVEDYIERCAVSLFEQTYDNIEYIFVNDQTPDNSWEVLHDVIDRYPQLKGRILLPTHDKNRGSAAVRNTAANLAGGDFIMWVDSDDYIETDTVEKAVDVAVRENADLVLYNYVIDKMVYSEIVKIPHFATSEERTCALLERTIPACVWCAMIKRSLYNDNNIRCLEGYNNGEDFQVTPRLSYYAQKISYTNDVLYHYDCTREDTYTRNFSEEKSAQVFKAFEILEDFFQTKPSVYMEALMRGKMKFVIGELVSSANAGNKCYFSKMSDLIDGMNRESLRGASLLERLFYNVRNPFFIRLVMTFGQKIKHTSLYIRTKMRG